MINEEKLKGILSDSTDDIEYNPEEVDIVSMDRVFVPKLQEDPDDQVANAITKLQDEFGLNIDNFSVPDALKNTDKIDTDDPAFSLASSKLAIDVLTRARLKGVIAQAVVADRLFDFIINTYSDKNSKVNTESLLMLDKAAKAYTDLTGMLDQYKKTGLKESLKNIAKARQINSEMENEDGESKELTMDEIRRLINLAQKK